MCAIAKKNSKHRRLHNLAEEQDYKCWYCRRKCFILCNNRDTKWYPDRATIEHRRPKFSGGGIGNNLVMACGACNNKKGNHPVYVLLVPAFSHLMPYIPTHMEVCANGLAAYR